MTRGSIHLRVKYTSNNGFTSIEDGYSRIMELSGSGKKRAIKIALWNGAYSHNWHGGTYEWNYKILSMESVYVQENTRKRRRVKNKVNNNHYVIEKKKLKKDHKDVAISKKKQQEELYGKKKGSVKEMPKANNSYYFYESETGIRHEYPTSEMAHEDALSYQRKNGFDYAPQIHKIENEERIQKPSRKTNTIRKQQSNTNRKTRQISYTKKSRH